MYAGHPLPPVTTEPMAETDPVEWSIHGTADISDARRRVADAASSAGLSPERSADVALVLSELVTNGLEHGTG
jgi:two-component sensor histidine kinase